jgi:hypothetical protein
MFRYTEKEMREFVGYFADYWSLEQDGAENDDDFYYAKGAEEAYKFVLNFMNEYKLEEVPNA